MADAECPRCRAEIAMSATDCGACGKPIVPVPWLRRLRGPGRRAPHAQVVDYFRILSPLKFAAGGLMWILIGLGGLRGVLKTNEALEEHSVQAAAMAEAPDRDGWPPPALESVKLAHEAAGHLLAGLGTFARVIVVVSWAGLLFEFISFRQMRRVLRAFPPTGPAT